MKPTRGKPMKGAKAAHGTERQANSPGVRQAPKKKPKATAIKTKKAR